MGMIKSGTRSRSARDRSTPLTDLRGWREIVLRGMLYAAAILGLPAVISGSLSAINDGQTERIILFGASYFFIVVLALGRNILPYPLRASVLLLVAGALGLNAIITTGLAGSGRVFLFAFCTISTLLMGVTAGIVSLLLSVAAIAVVAWAASANIVSFSPEVMSAADPSSWITGGAVFGLLAMVIVVAIGSLQRGLEEVIRREQRQVGRLQREQESLERDVSEHSESMTRQAHHMQTTAEIARLVTSTIDLTAMMSQAVDVIRDRFGFYHVSLFTLDDSATWAVLAASTGEPGRLLLARHHRLGVGSASIVGWVTANRAPRTASDVEQDPFHFKNPILPDTRSEMAVPMIVGDELIGALDVQSTEVGAFGVADQWALEAVASELAVGIQSARMIQQLNERLVRTQRAIHAQTERSWSQVAGSSASVSYQLDQSGIVYSGQVSGFPTNRLAASSGRTSASPDGREVAVPVQVRGEVVATIAARRPADSDPWTAADVTLLEAVAGQASLALENARQYAEEQRRAAELEVINRVSQAVSQLLSLDSLYRVVHAQMAQILGEVDMAIALYHPQEEKISFPYVSEGNELLKRKDIPLGEGLTSVVIQSQQPLIEEEDTQARAVQLGVRLESGPAKSWLSVPMLVGDDIIGVLSVYDSEIDHRFTDDDLALLATVSSQVATAFQNARLLDQTQRSARRERLIHEITSKVRQATSIPTILETTARELARALNADQTMIRLGAPETGGSSGDASQTDPQIRSGGDE
jgi:GAF domain-containing protein